MMIKSRKLTIMILLAILISMVLMALLQVPKHEEKSIVTYSFMNESKAEIPTYIFHINFDDKKSLIKGTMNIQVPNTSSKQLQELYFHLYPNAFANWKWEEASMPESIGYLRIKEAVVNDIKVVAHQRDTLLKINLPIPLKPKEIANVNLNFELKIPDKGLRLTKVNNTAFLAQWYPMLAVFDEEDGWHIEPYTTTGDPFFTEVANYEVYLQLPKGYRVISTGNESRNTIEELENTQKVYLSQKKVRDFALMFTKDYQKISAMDDNKIIINLYYLPNQQEVAGLLFGGAMEAMDYYGKTFGPYPLEEVDIVLANAGNGIAGMEYPGLVTSDPSVRLKGDSLPAYNVVAHELAHQWWYSTVGNNQIAEPWLDEGLTSFSEYLYMEQVLGRKDIDEIMGRIKKYTDDIGIENNINVLQSIYNYGDNYGLFVYGRPAAMLWEIKKRYGYDNVKKIMQTYYQKYKYRVATTEDFVQVVNQVLDQDMSTFFKNWFLLK